MGIQGVSLESGDKKRRQQKQSVSACSCERSEAKTEAKRFDPSERNFNFEFRSWATALSEFVTLFLPLNLLEIQAFCLNFWILLRAVALVTHFCYAKTATLVPPRRFHRLAMTTHPLNPPPQGRGTLRENPYSQR